MALINVWRRKVDEKPFIYLYFTFMVVCLIKTIRGIRQDLWCNVCTSLFICIGHHSHPHRSKCDAATHLPSCSCHTKNSSRQSFFSARRQGNRSYVWPSSGKWLVEQNVWIRDNSDLVNVYWSTLPEIYFKQYNIQTLYSNKSTRKTIIRGKRTPLWASAFKLR